MKYNPYKVLIYSCWSLLAVAFILTLLGADWFKAGTDSTWFITMCTFIDSKLWLKAIVMCITSLVLNTFVSLAVLKQKFYTNCQILVFVPVIILGSLSSWISPILQLIFNIIHLFLPVIFNRKALLRCFASIIIVSLFQQISLFAKMIGGISIDESIPTLVALILQLDTVIMCALYYLYSTKERRA